MRGAATGSRRGDRAAGGGATGGGIDARIAARGVAGTARGDGDGDGSGEVARGDGSGEVARGDGVADSASGSTGAADRRTPLTTAATASPSATPITAQRGAHDRGGRNDSSASSSLRSAVGATSRDTGSSMVPVPIWSVVAACTRDRVTPAPFPTSTASSARSAVAALWRSPNTGVQMARTGGLASGKSSAPSERTDGNRAAGFNRIVGNGRHSRVSCSRAWSM